MLKDTIERLLSSKAIQEQIKSRNSKNIYFASTFIGETIRYCMIHGSREDITETEVVEYLRSLKEILYFSNSIEDFNVRAGYFNDERAKLIIESIAKNLDIDSANMSTEDETRIREYFLNNYVKNGYVFHSFPSARAESVARDGFTCVEKLWDNDEVKKVAKIFEKHGVLTALGGYLFYKDGGMYVEHNPDNVLFHSLSSPEWFKFLTSASHNGTNFDISTSPFYLKNYDACRHNVEDLCTHARLDDEEKEQVLHLFEDAWKVLGKRELTTAIIPKSKIGNDEIVLEQGSLSEMITYVLQDRAHQYDEHVGNVINPEEITGEDVEIIQMPYMDELIECDTFHRETEEELYDPKRVISMMASGLSSGEFDITQEQYSACINNIEERMNDDYYTRREKITSNLDRMDERINNSSLDEDRKHLILEDMRGYETQRQLDNEKTIETSPNVPDDT